MLLRTRRQSIITPYVGGNNYVVTLDETLDIYDSVTQSISSGSSFDFYISPAGTGSASTGGTFADPWPLSMLDNATAQARYAGKTVGLMDGTYDVSAANSTARAFAAPLYQIAGGSSGSPTIIKAVNARQAWIQAKTSGGTYTGNKTSPYYNGYSQPNEGGLLAHLGSGYVTIDGLKMSGDRSTLIRIGSGPGSSYNIPGITIKNCELFDCNDAQGNNGTADGANNAAIQIFNTDGALITNNYIHDMVSWVANSADHLSSILMWFCKNTVVEYNTLVEAGNIYGKEAGTQGTTARYNYIKITSFTAGGSSGMGDLTGAATGGLTLASSIHHNIIVANSGGMNLASTLGGSTDGWTTNLSAYNNTIVVVDNLTSNLIQQHFTAWYNSSNQNKLSFYNNLITGDLSIDRKPIAANATAWNVCGYNLYPSSGTRWRMLLSTSASPDSSVNDYSSLATYRTAVQSNGGISSSLMEVGTVESSQAQSSLFVQIGSNADYYKLKVGSNALSAGKSDGTSGGTICDIGGWDGVITQIGCNF